ncbi:MAG TPA: ABC transporter permease [Acidimicrobiales bacterium]|nr:ABC transporter permease [Acidimicrobiales bacterium]
MGSYARSELVRRKGRTIVTALGLAGGVALVLSIVGASAGLADAQNRVLTPLSSVGTDILVTRQTAADANATNNANGNGGTAAANGPGARRGFGQDQAATAEETNAIKTDLSKLGNPGDKFTHDFFVASGGVTFDTSVLTQLQKVSGVAAVVPGLTMVATHQTGTVPQIVATINQPEQTVQPAPPTEQERADIQACLQKQGVTFGNDGGGQQTAPAPGDNGGGGGGGRGFRGVGGQAFLQCLPQRFQQFRIPQQTLTQALNPPQTDITSTTYTAGGVDPKHPDSGLVTASQVVKGHYLSSSATDEVMVAASYAKSNNLDLGKTLAINGKTFKVVGIVQPAVQGSAADVYFPLSTLQDLSSRQGRINTVLVKANSSGNVDKVAAAIRKQLGSEAQVVTTASLASQVTGSLKDTKKLADRFGGVLAIIVLGSAFALAALLTLSSIGKRVREIGTLRAVGWPRKMVMRQILVETLGISVIGAVLGVALGLFGGFVIGKASPSLSATVPTVNSSARLLAAVGATSRNAAATNATRTLHLTVPVDVTTIVLGVFLALLGGLLAGGIGAWRASRLQPAEALRNLG